MALDGLGGSKTGHTKMREKGGGKGVGRAGEERGRGRFDKNIQWYGILKT